MPKILDIGQKVQYLYEGGWQVGTVHGAQTHETTLGIITKIMYIIDTGKTVREDIGAEPTGKKIKNPGTDYLVPEMKQVTVRQPEQVCLPQDFVRPISTTETD